MEGWIKVHRRITDNPDYFAEPFTRIMAFVDLNIIANHAPGFIRQRGIKVEVKRGQVGTSRETLAKRWQWSPGKVKRYLDELEDDGLIVQQKTNVINCITLVNYDTEQQHDIAKWTADNTPNGWANDTADGTAGSTANDLPNDTAECRADSTADDTPNGRQTVQQTDANKNNKKNKEEKEDKNTHTQFLPSDLNFKKRAREILDWVTANFPEFLRMEFPLTLDQLVGITKKYDNEDIMRVIEQMHNKRAHKNRSAFATFSSFAGRDEILKEKKQTQKTLTDEVRQKELARQAVIRDNIEFNRLYASGIASGAIQPKPVD